MASAFTTSKDDGAKASLLQPQQQTPLDFPAVLRGRKLLLATESLGPINGVSRTTTSLIRYLQQNGVKVAVIAPEVRSSNPETRHVDWRLRGYPLPYNPDLSVAYPFRITKLFSRTFTPDVIYLASPASVGFQFMLQLRQLQDAPPVICNFQTDLSSYSSIIFPIGMHEYAVWLLGLVQGFLFSHPSVRTVFYPSSGIRKYLESVGVRSDKLVHLGRGVDTTLFDPTHRDNTFRAEVAPNGEIIILTVSRLAPEKGFDFLAKAALVLAKEAIPFKLMIVGGNHNPAVEAEVRKYFDPIRENVVFTGFLTGQALARAYASADIFLHCSVTETFGLVVLEAMASGLPVVARDQGGPSEIVRHEKTGYLIPPDDLDTFVARTAQLLTDRDLRSAMTSVSRQIALETSWEKINNRAAWQIAASLQQHQAGKLELNEARSRKHLFVRFVSWPVRKFCIPVISYIRVWAAVGVIVFFWLVAVVPLILHGTFAFISS